ncbi:MAG: GTP 3',8-cyclase MoaA [Pseudomonadota bacterium]
MTEKNTRADDAPRALIDPFGRTISYLRLSVTDRCDLRCHYCMAERPDFLPKSQVLGLEELDLVASAFIARGVNKLRITGGEPLARKNVMSLFRSLSRHLGAGGLRELTLTTNATQLARYAKPLADLGVRRVNVSLDSLDRDAFTRITRRDALDAVLRGIEAAQAAGLKIKLNTVALKNDNLDEIPDIVSWAHERDIEVTLIEVMPLGEIDGNRLDQYAPLSLVREQLEERWTLTPSTHRSGGPARYMDIKETGGRLGFITPLTNNFCDGCNRVRVTCTGQLYMCLGQEDRADLRAALRDGGPSKLDAVLDDAMRRKPKGHEFDYDANGATPAAPRFMSATGG